MIWFFYNEDSLKVGWKYPDTWWENQNANRAVNSAGVLLKESLGSFYNLKAYNAFPFELRKKTPKHTTTHLNSTKSC